MGISSDCFKLHVSGFPDNFSHVPAQSRLSRERLLRFHLFDRLERLVLRIG